MIVYNILLLYLDVLYVVVAFGHQWSFYKEELLLLLVQRTTYYLFLTLIYSEYNKNNNYNNNNNNKNKRRIDSEHAGRSRTEPASVEACSMFSNQQPLTVYV
jgi:hypothetical protein